MITFRVKVWQIYMLSSRLPGCKQTEQPHSPLNCFAHRTDALAGKSKVPKINLPQTVFNPSGVLIDRPIPLIASILLIIGLKSNSIFGLHGPT